MERSQKSSANLMDKHQRLTAEILTKYREVLRLATVQAEGDRANSKPEAIAVTGIAIKMEFEALYSSLKELLTLSRQMKELWVFGPLGRDDTGQKAKEEQIEKDVAQVASLLGGLEERNMKELAEKYGGTWEPIRPDENA